MGSLDLKSQGLCVEEQTAGWNRGSFQEVAREQERLNY